MSSLRKCWKDPRCRVIYLGSRFFSENFFGNFKILIDMIIFCFKTRAGLDWTAVFAEEKPKIFLMPFNSFFSS